jgi:CheY-like chemotaxis protein
LGECREDLVTARRLKPTSTVIEARRSMSRPRALPVLITVDFDGSATALYTIPETDHDREEPLFRFPTLDALLAAHDLDAHEVEELRPIAVFPLSALLVDDEVNLHEVVRTVLHDSGYRTTTVATLADARAHLGQAQPTVMLLDLRVAGECGEELLLELANAPNAPPTVVFSARDDATYVASRFGVPLLAKPFDLADLLRAIESAIRDGKRPTVA